MIFVFYLLVAWYFDNVLSSNRGASAPPYFFLKPTYWFPNCFKSTNRQNPKKRKLSFTSLEFSLGSKSPRKTSKEEKRVVKELEHDNVPCTGVRILGLSKTFKIFSLSEMLFGCCKKSASGAGAYHHKNKKKSNTQTLTAQGVTINNSETSDSEGSAQKGEIEALKNVYLEVQQGELLSIMGHNGAGKTTLINVLGGLIAHDAGNARIFDSDLNDDF